MVVALTFVCAGMAVGGTLGSIDLEDGCLPRALVDDVEEQGPHVAVEGVEQVSHSFCQCPW